MPPIPRNLPLDRAIARSGTDAQAVLVYGDWLRDHDHPFADWLSEAARADSGQKLRSLAFAAAGPENEPFLLRWAGGVVAELGVQPMRYRHGDPLHQRLRRVLDEDWMQLVGAVSVELTGGEDDLLVLEALGSLPETVGTLSLFDPKCPLIPSPLIPLGASPLQATSCIDLGGLRLPHLRDLRLRTGRIVGVPAAPPGLERLEVGCAIPGPLQEWPLEHLEVLHVWTGMGVSAIQNLLARTKRLHTLGLHHAGREPIHVADLLPPSVTTLMIAAPEWTTAAFEACGLPPHVTGWAPLSAAAALPTGGGWRRELPPDMPIYL